MLSNQVSPDVRDAALEVIYSKRLAVHEMKDIRECILQGDRVAGLSLLRTEYELTDVEAEALMAYMEPAIRGQYTTFVEIKHSDIHFSTEDEVTDVEDPLSPGFLYFGRRGNRFGEVVTTGHTSSGGREIYEVFFCGERLGPEKLDQVWKLVREDRASPRVTSKTGKSSGDKQRRLEELLAARCALNLKYPLEVYEKLKLEPEDALAYCRMSIRYSSEFKVSEGEHVSLGWQPVPRGYINPDGRVHPDYKGVRRYPPLPEGMYATPPGDGTP